MLTLDLVKKGEIASIAKLNTTGSEKKHLLDIGFVDGIDIYIVANNGGDIICRLMNSRLGITKNVAKNIIVNIKNK